ncbi:MAG: C40 family peptidase [Deltaproteobacteria bacterium]|nr:C40 family peptidase [Deltaproteobacteria bacterium]MBW2305030.1 C40 family peptidase [Deltaproteobacteria bacterium]
MAGYAVQVGAFSKLENAVRLTASLEDQGMEAYYFRDRDGLYKVRFGNFPTRQEARRTAGHLQWIGILESFYIVSPDESPAARSRILGVGRLREEIVETAEGFLGIPYRWGGSSPGEGFDCSGLTMAVYRLNGLDLPRSSREQFRQGVPVDPGDLSKGDLVFFATSGMHKVSHVGLYAGENRFIHAPGKGKRIRMDSLSHPYYARRFVGARTYLERGIKGRSSKSSGRGPEDPESGS